MFVKNLGIISLGGFLIFATVPAAPAQSNQPGKRSGATHSDKATQGTTDHQGREKPANMSRDDVMQIQRALRDWEYNPGAVNGMMSPETKQAIREFQLLNGLPVTGIPDEATRSALGGSQNSSISKTSDVDHNARLKGGVSTGTQQDSSKDQPTQYAQNQSSPNRANDEHHATTDTNKDRSAKSDKDSNSSKADSDAADRVQKAAEVLQELTAGADKRVPNELLSSAEAVAVIPHMIKGAFGIGGRYGKGVVSQRLDNGRWSAPAFMQIGGGSFGAQIGVSSTDLVLVFTDAKALDQLGSGKDLKLGVDAGVVAGPIGRSAEAGVNAKLDTAIYAYSRSKGLFAGVALDGAVLDIDNSENKEVYGDVPAKQILSSATGNSTTRPFMETLEKIMPKKKVSQR